MARARNWRTFVEGADEIAKMFNDIAEEAENILDEAANSAADIVLDAAKELCPKVTGALANSLAVKPEKNKKSNRKTYRIYSKGARDGGVRYAFAVEAGTTKMKAKPFLRPALDNNKSQVKETIAETISKGIDKAVR